MSKKPCPISFKPVGNNKPCKTIINGGLKVKKNIVAECDLTVKKCLNVKNIVYSNKETITESGQTVSGVKSLSWINTNGTGVLSDNTKDGFYKKVVKIINNDISWEEIAGLTASDGATSDNFGSSVSMNSDGTKVIIGAPIPTTGSGKAYIFGLSGGSWVEEAGLTASDGAINDQFGYSVSMNADGSKVIIGARFDDAPNSDQGKAYIFGLSGGSWVEEAGLTASDGAFNDQFGISVAMNSDGTKVIIGASRDNDPTNSGKAYIFGLSGGSWIEEAGLTASDADNGDEFGNSVAMNADGTKVIIGAFNDDDPTRSGKAYIFGLSGGSWIEEAGLTASDADTDDRFGFSVSMNADGNKVIIGTPFDDDQDDSGKAYIFGLSGSSWVEEVGLKASDGATGDNFGNSVSMNSDGTKVIIGSRNDNNLGKSYIFGLSGGSWVEEAGLTASDGANADQFGWSVSMNAGGTSVIIGARFDDDPNNSGKAYIFGGFEDYTLTYNTTETHTLTNVSDSVCFIYNKELNKWIKLI